MKVLGNLIGFTLVTLVINLGLSRMGSDGLLLQLIPGLGGLGVGELNDIALAVIRILIGLIFIGHGWSKVMGGVETWKWMGSQMQNFGIGFGFVLWGLLAAYAEFGGGLALTLGWNTRFHSFLLAGTMLVAAVHHIMNGDPWMKISFPLGMLVVFLGLMIAGNGSGKYSLGTRLLGGI